jgi:hypothetical protein
MDTLLAKETRVASQAVAGFKSALAATNISIEIHRDFSFYKSIRHHYGDANLNQAFDPQYTHLGHYDFWILARGRQGDEVATYCMRRFIIDDFFHLIRTQALWFSRIPDLMREELRIDCEIPPFGGAVVHGGGLWVRRDFRGWSRLASVLPRLARALALLEGTFDHDTGMIRSAAADSPRAAERKAAFAALRICGFARVSRFVDGWFPPEGRNAIMHLCHSTKVEAMASLADQASTEALSAYNQKKSIPCWSGVLPDEFAA